MMPKTGHVVNLEEPDLFNMVVGDFLARVEAGRWGPRDPRTRAPKPGPAPGTSAAAKVIVGRPSEEPAMLKWAVIFLIIAIVAGIFGFTGVEQASATIAQWLFGIFLVLFLGALVIGLAIGSKLMS